MIAEAMIREDFCSKSSFREGRYLKCNVWTHKGFVWFYDYAFLIDYISRKSCEIWTHFWWVCDILRRVLRGWWKSWKFCRCPHLMLKDVQKRWTHSPFSMHYPFWKRYHKISYVCVWITGQRNITVARNEFLYQMKFVKLKLTVLQISVTFFR